MMKRVFLFIFSACIYFATAAQAPQPDKNSVKEKVGAVLNDEVPEYGNNILHASAVNIQYHLLCERNFEAETYAVKTGLPFLNIKNKANFIPAKGIAVEKEPKVPLPQTGTKEYKNTYADPIYELNNFGIGM